MNIMTELYKYTQAGLLDLYQHCLESENLSYEDINVQYLLPYLHPENRNYIFLDLYSRGDDLSMMAGFVTVDGYRKLVERIEASAMMPVGFENHIHFLLPELVDRLLPYCVKTGKLGNVEATKLLHQASPEGKDKFIDDVIFNNLKDLKLYINFASKKMRRRLALYYVNGTLGEKYSIDDVAPFLLPEDRKLILEQKEQQ